VWGRLNAADAAVLKNKIAAMVATVCQDDPRTVQERRADALGAWSNGNDHLPCACESPNCPARETYPAPSSSVVVNVYTDRATLDGVEGGASAGTAVLGTEVLPTGLLAELLRNGATLRPLCTPDTEPEPRYRPSAALARIVRARDLTCRFPGCTTPAEFCDIDHVIPYPLGVTHASNLACLCRKHHHLKTFWTGDWQFTLLSDGAAVWTSPTGHRYTTHPGSRTLFPEWDTDTGTLPRPTTAQAFSTDRGVMMPLRKRTRDQDREARIKANANKTPTRHPSRRAESGGDLLRR